MKAFLHVTFVLSQGFKNIYMNFRAEWLRITENKVVIQVITGETKEFPLKKISDFNVVTLY